MASPKDKNEEEILERIAALYGQLDDIRDQRREVHTVGTEDGPRVVLVTRRLPRDRRRGQRVPDTMDQALSNFRQVTASGRDVYWVGSPVTQMQTPTEQRALRDQLLREQRYAPVFLDAKRERLFYDGFCKRVLWPLFHSSPPTTEDTVTRARAVNYEEEDRDDDDTMWNAYVGANQAFADVIRDVAQDGDLIWIQDYHFMLLPRMLRQLSPDSKLGFFLHVPFPSSELYRTLPFREEILRGLLAADLLGFQTYDYARHFLSSCEMVLGLETAPDHVEHEGHLTRVCVCPVGIEPEVVKARSLASPTLAAIRRLEGQLQGRALFLGVDTLDPTKGLVHKFLAFEDLFSQHPELADELVFVQVVLGAGGAANLKPEDRLEGKLITRTTSERKNKPTGRLELDVVEQKTSKGVFSTLERQLHAMVSRINSQYATLDFEGPVQYFGADAKTPPGEATLAALFALADVLVITPIRDGMNVVPFEYLVAREAHKKLGAVLLSEFAGCARSLGGAVLVNPWDTRRVTTLLYRLFRRARRANARDARTRRRKVDRVTSSSTGSAYASDSDEFDSDLDEDDSDDDSEAEDSSADEADDSDDGRQLSTVASSDAGSLLKKPNLAQGGALRSRSIRARGVERKRAHEHMLQYVYNFTARSWARRFLDQLQEAAETKASRTLCRELTVPQLTAPYTKTKRRVIVLELEGVLAKPTALAELIDVPVKILNYLEALCNDPQNRAVVILSARSAETLSKIFEHIKCSNLVLAAEEGLSIRWGPNEPFEMQVSDFDLDLSWLDDAEPLIAYYTERTPGSVVERKVSGLAWHYRDCDLNHGAWQARQLQVALGELAKHVPLSVFSGDKFIEVRPMRLSVPNVLELTLKKFQDADLALEEPPTTPPQELPRRKSFDRVDDDSQTIDRHVDYVLFVASGNGLVDEEIFESMAPPPFDLDEFCSRVARLNEGRDIEDEDPSTPVKFHKTPPSSPGRMAKPLTPLRLSDEAPVLEQFKAVLAGGDRGTSDPARRADLVARREFNPRRDFPPSAMLFQAMRRRYGRDWSRVDLPTSASACWALVGGRTPRPGAPRAERSTFLAEFEDLHGVDSPDVLPSLAEATSGQPLVRQRSVDDAPTSPSEKPSMGAVLTRALHANALALSRALRFPAPRADSLEEAARSVRQEAPPSPARLEKIQPWTGQKAQTPRTKERSQSPRLEDEEKWESVQDKLSSQDPRLKEAREVVPTSRLSKPGAAPTLQRPAPVYVSVASRGAATAQQRREFDRAARIASAKRAAVPPTPKKAALAIDAEAAAAAAAAAMAGPPPSPSQNPEQAPDLSDLAAAAAAAADDTHPGLDLPLLTFSCIVGIKLSQATYYLRSQDLVAALLAQLADCASVSQDD